MSTTLLMGMNHGYVPDDEAKVRSSVTVVDKAAPPAVEAAPPEYNDAGTDPDTEGGLTTRQLASYVRPSQQYPLPEESNANTDFASRINDQVSTSGTAAAREASGQWGHGTMQVIEGIEPAQQGIFGDEYFAAERPEFRSETDLSPAQPADPDTLAQAQATGVANSRDAYAAFLASVTGG